MKLLTLKMYDSVPDIHKIIGKFNSLKSFNDPNIFVRSLDFLEYILFKMFIDDFLDDFRYSQFMTLVQYQLMNLNTRSGMNNCFIYDLIVAYVIYVNEIRKSNNLKVIDTFNMDICKFWRIG